MSTQFLFQRLSTHGRHSFQEAHDIARYLKSALVGTPHLLLSLFLENGSLGSHTLSSMGFEKESLGKLCLRSPAGRNKRPTAPPVLSDSAKDALRRAFLIASRRGYPYVGTEHLVAGLLEEPDAALRTILSELSIRPDRIATVLGNHLRFERYPDLARVFEAPEQVLTRIRESETSPELSPLEEFAHELGDNEEYPLVGREQEIARLTHILARRTKNNPLLIGEPGVGKTAIVAALARAARSGSGSPTLAGKRIFALDLALVVAGTSFRGEFEARLKDIVDEVRNNKDFILFIDEIHTLVGAGNAQGGLDAANILKPALARGEIRLIGATTLAEYKRHIEKDAALERRFQTISVREPTPKETLRILASSLPVLEAFHGVRYESAALTRAVTLAERFLPERSFPDKALDILDEAAASLRSDAPDGSALALARINARIDELSRHKRAALDDNALEVATAFRAEIRKLESERTHTATTQRTRAGHPPRVSEQTIITTLARMTAIPEEKLVRKAPRERLAALQSALERRLVGQPEAIAAALTTITRTLGNVNDPKRPLGSFLILGPTGVGKTEFARILAEEFFGSERCLIRFDMSEFMERHHVAQMLGAPAGYVGYGEGGKLTERVRRNPYALVLFDEIEKAHPDVFNILLQILDEGRLTDAEGRAVSFRNTIIILTSNIGTASFTQTAKIGFGRKNKTVVLPQEFEAIKREVLEELKKMLRPELLGRIDRTLVFRPLDAPAIERIAKHALARLGTRLAEEQVTFTPTAAAIRLLAQKSFAPEVGARLVRRILETEVEEKIATLLLGRARPARRLTLATHKQTFVCRAT